MSTGHTTAPIGAHHGRRARAARGVAAVVVLVSFVAGAARTEPAAAAVSVPDPGAAEAAFVARINQLRASQGLGTLSVDPELTAQARAWASTMTGEGRIFHSGDLSAGISSNWQKLGENVGVGGDVDPLFDAFVASPSHYANLVDPSYTRLGVGVVATQDRIYTTHRFMALAPPPPPPPPPTAPPTTAPPPTAPPTTAAPTTVAPTTAPSTAPRSTSTTASGAPPKLGPVHRVAELLAASERSGSGADQP